MHHRNEAGDMEDQEEEEEEEEQYTKKKASARSIAELTLLIPGITYTFIRQGSAHKPIFLCQCTVGDESFFGYGCTKKEAKQECAQNALDVMEGDDTWQSAVTFEKQAAPHVAAYNPQPRVANPLEVMDNSKGDGSYSITEERLLSFIGKHPVQIMLELSGVGYQRQSYSWRQDICAKAPSFTAILTIDNDMVFQGTAGAKKEAKKNAAREAVIHYFGFDPTSDLATQEKQIHQLYRKLSGQEDTPEVTAADAAGPVDKPAEEVKDGHVTQKS